MNGRKMMTLRSSFRLSLLCALIGCGPSLSGGKRAPEQLSAGREAPAPVAAPAQAPLPLAERAPLQLPEVERVRIDDGGAPGRGSTRPRVTIVEIGDYQCPFTARAEATMARLLAAFPDDVRLVFRHNPLPFHQDAVPAAEMALEAYDQGGEALFWRVHALLFESQRALGRDDLERYGAQLGMSLPALRRALDDREHDAHIQSDQREAQRAGAQGTPSFFINGRLLRGAHPYEEFERVVREEIAVARAIEEHGVPRERVYARLMQDAVEAAAPPPEARTVADPNAIYRVPLDGRAAQGRADALVTIVEHADFQCPFSARVQATLERVRQTYGGEVRIVFRHHPLPFHPDAMPAAEAAEEVRAQLGDEAFFRYAAILFASQRQLDSASLGSYAAQVGARASGVERALGDHRHRARIEEDQRLAETLGANGTPAFFVNGRNVRGAQPFERFAEVIDQEMARARALLAGGTPRSGLYQALTANGATTAQLVPAAPAPAAPPAEPDRRYSILIPPGAPARGASNARVTIQMFADLQCPFSARVQRTVEEILRRYPTQVRVVWRDYPLPFHINAIPAAEAAREARAQAGDRAFWALVGRIFERGGLLNDGELAELASTVPGVDRRGVARALADHRHRAAVEADIRAIADAGASIGTPSFFIEGVLVRGAQPLEVFERVIDEALAAPADQPR